MTLNDLKELTPAELKVATKELVLSGYTSAKAAEILGLDEVTAWRYAKAPTPDNLKEFEIIFSNVILEMKQKGISMVQKRLLELIPKEKRIDQVVKAGDYLEGKVQTNDVKVQVNNFIKEEKDKYGI